MRLVAARDDGCRTGFGYTTRSYGRSHLTVGVGSYSRVFTVYSLDNSAYLSAFQVAELENRIVRTTAFDEMDVDIRTAYVGKCHSRHSPLGSFQYPYRHRRHTRKNRVRVPDFDLFTYRQTDKVLLSAR